MKKILIIFVCIALFELVAWLGLQKFIVDGKALTTRLVAELEHTTGRRVHIDDAHVAVKFWPLPEVSYGDFSISNPEGTSGTALLHADKIALRLSLAALLKAQIKPSKITLDGVELSLERLPSGKPNWLFTSQKGEGEAFSRYFTSTSMAINNGVIRYLDPQNGLRRTWSGISGALDYEHDATLLDFQGQARVQNQPSSIIAQMEVSDLAQSGQDPVSLQVMVQRGGLKLVTRGKVIALTGDPVYIGQVEANGVTMDDAASLLMAKDASKSIPESAVGFYAKGDFNLSTQALQLKSLTLKAIDSKKPSFDGTVNGEYRFGKNASITLNPAFSEVDLDRLLVAYRTMAASAPAPSKNVLASLNDILKGLSGQIQVTAEKAKFNQKTLQNVNVSLSLDKGVVTINQGYATCPGNTKLSVSGVGGAAEDGLNFNGNIALAGVDAQAFFGLLTPSGVALPKLDLGVFGLRSNLTLTKEQFRLSEMQARVNDTGLAGAVIIHLGARPKLESFLRVANADLDKLAIILAYLQPQNTENATQKEGNNLFDVRYLNKRFEWLNKVGMDASSDFLLENFVLFDRKGERARFRIDMGRNMLALSDVNAVYNGSIIKGNYALTTQEGKNPYFTIDADWSDLDLVDLFPNIAHLQNDDEWQVFITTPLDLMPLQTYRGQIKAKIGKLNFRTYQFVDADIDAALDNDVLNLRRFHSQFWDGVMDARAMIQAGAIPSFSGSLLLSNANLVKLSQATPLLKDAAGRIGVRGQAETSGVNLKSWLNNASGAFSLIGKDVSFQGFGMATLARAVPVARSVADLVSARRLALSGGITRFNDIGGQVALRNGQIQITQLLFGSEEGKGVISGTVSLVEETVDLLMQFYLNSTIERDRAAPKSVLALKGRIGDISMELSTEDLEAFVARSAAERALSGE